MPHRVNTAMKAVEATGFRSLRDALIADSGCAELCRANDAVLPTSHLGNQAVGIGTFLTHQVSKAPTPVSLPFIAGVAGPGPFVAGVRAREAPGGAWRRPL